MNSTTKALLAIVAVQMALLGIDFYSHRKHVVRNHIEILTDTTASVFESPEYKRLLKAKAPELSAKITASLDSAGTTSSASPPTLRQRHLKSDKSEKSRKNVRRDIPSEAPPKNTKSPKSTKAPSMKSRKSSKSDSMSPTVSFFPTMAPTDSPTVDGGRAAVVNSFFLTPPRVDEAVQQEDFQMRKRHLSEEMEGIENDDA
jgi:hypothetical protein